MDWSGSPTTISSSAPWESSARSSVCAGSVSWYSSTRMRRRTLSSPASSAGSASSASVAARISSAGSQAPGRDSEVTSRYSCRNAPAATHSGRLRARPSAANCGPSRPRSTARSSRSRSSPANARVPIAGCNCAGQRDRPRSRSPLINSRSTRSCSGPGQQPRRRQPRGDRRHAEHAECVGVKRARHRFAHRATEPGGNAVAQFARGAPPERQHQQVLDRDAGGDSRHRRLDQRGGLARARTGEYEQRTAVVLDDPPLRSVEIRRCGDATTWPHQPV